MILVSFASLVESETLSRFSCPVAGKEEGEKEGTGGVLVVAKEREEEEQDEEDDDEDDEEEDDDEDDGDVDDRSCKCAVTSKDASSRDHDE